MRRLHSHTIGIDQGSEILFSDFENGGIMWSGDGPREVRLAVTFATAYKSAPTVQVSIGMWDTDGKTNQRADLSAEGITPSGFDIVFRTWGDSRIARVRADWMAIGELRDDDEWELY